MTITSFSVQHVYNLYENSQPKMAFVSSEQKEIFCLSIKERFYISAGNGYLAIEEVDGP